MQKTEKMQFNLIEGNDEVLQSLEALNENFQKIDENIGNGGGIEEEKDPTVPEYVKNIKESDIENWNNKQEKLMAGENITINEDGTIDASGGGLTYANIVVNSEEWLADETYEQFGYKADIVCEGVTADFFSDVTFNVTEALSGNYAPISLTGEGTVTIYAVEQPENAITIPSIICIKGA